MAYTSQLAKIMKKILFIGVCALFLSHAGFAQNQRLYGTWRLVSSVSTVVSTGEKYYPLGKAPAGYITYGPGGRMQVIIVSDQRASPSHAAIADMTDQERKDLLMSLTAYAGTYDFDGKTVTHHFELSWNQVWSGTDQSRDVHFDGNMLIFTSKPAPSPKDGRMSTVSVVWEKVN